jgi:glutathione S-transferase
LAVPAYGEARPGAVSSVAPPAVRKGRALLSVLARAVRHDVDRRAQMETSNMSVPILTYFAFRGLGEPIRLFYEDLGLPYEDRRIDGGAEWEALKPQMQFRQMPRLQQGALTLFQCQAILRHLARANGLAGDTEAERIRCDVGAEAARDLQQRLWDHFWSPGSDTTEAARAFGTGGLAEALGLVSGWLGDAPFFGGGRALFADYYALTVVDEAAAFFPAAVERVANLAAYRRRMYERPGLAAYAASGRQPDTYGFDPIRGIRRPDSMPD